MMDEYKCLSKWGKTCLCFENIDFDETNRGPLQLQQFETRPNRVCSYSGTSNNMEIHVEKVVPKGEMQRHGNA